MRAWCPRGRSIKIRLIFIFFTLLSNLQAITVNIGTTSLKGSLPYENLRYAVERWNSEQATHTEVAFRIASPSAGLAPIEERVCEVVQHSVVAIIVPPSEPRLDSPMLHSMCHHLQIPCLAVHNFGPSTTVSDFLSQMGPRRGLAAQATREFIDTLRWTSFLLAYQSNTDLEDVAPLMFDRNENDHSTFRPVVKQENDLGPPTPKIIVKVKRLPNNTDEFEPFLKYIRNRLKQTNIVIHSSNITVLYSLIQLARGMNMTEQPYSYVFTHTDLSLLEDFFNAIGPFHCNITGLQLVKNDPMMKTELALTTETVWTIGHAVSRLKELGQPPRTASLLCDAKDTWKDGRRMHEAIRNLRLPHQITGEISFDTYGRRKETRFYGVGRISPQFVKVKLYQRKND
ncbi:unnamed protein product, partial [Mesorhabditis belari]|uniref:Receptor ligand binding region domain-containing protein n=1 Tax=Mesorhabditis belari TaxID=2138241 RepID=A0AAF3J651_9BILA